MIVSTQGLWRALINKCIERFVTHGGKIILKGITEAIGLLCTGFLGRYYAVFALKVVVVLVAGKGVDGFFSSRIKIRGDFLDCFVLRDWMHGQNNIDR